MRFTKIQLTVKFAEEFRIIRTDGVENDGIVVVGKEDPVNRMRIIMIMMIIMKSS